LCRSKSWRIGPVRTNQTKSVAGLKPRAKDAKSCGLGTETEGVLANGSSVSKRVELMAKIVGVPEDAGQFDVFPFWC